MITNYIVEDFPEAGLITYDSETGFDKENLEEVIFNYFEPSLETDACRVEEIKGNPTDGFIIVAELDPDLDGLLEEVKLTEVNVHNITIHKTHTEL